MSSRWLGIGCIVAGLLLNKWALERLLAADEHIESRAFFGLVVAAQIVALAIGGSLIVRKWSDRLPRWLRACGLLAVLAAIAIGGYGTLRAFHIVDPDRAQRTDWQTMFEAEEVILELEPALVALAHGVQELHLGTGEASEWFADHVSVTDIASPTDGASSWRISAARPIARNELDVWSAFADHVETVDRAKFSFVDGRNTLVFEGRARTRSRRVAWILAEVELEWDHGDRWQISAWTTTRFDVRERAETMFDEVFDVWADDHLLARARESIHENHVIDVVHNGGEPPHPEFSIFSDDKHPGVSVIDIDRDGWDDIYIMARWGKNMLLHNRGGTGYRDIAGQVGLAIEDHSSSALFADFDNDGDDDVFVGRTVERTRYLINDDGQFRDAADRVAGELPYLVSAISAADYDADGLLDVYIATYYGDVGMTTRAGDATKYLLPEDAERYRAATNADDFHPYLNGTGPPNVLLRNTGDGSFELVRDTPVSALRNTFQAAWSDWDDDGDPDLFLANDFGANTLFRNDGGTFVDVTSETGVADVGFGMGASWGDYDGDGRVDLYVSNMYSKAGKRITAQLDSLDPRLAQMARGNSLFKNNGKTFERVPTAERAGWSWGSQFVDVDNDGFLDIYALNGYYTPPPMIESVADM